MEEIEHHIRIYHGTQPSEREDCCVEKPGPRREQIIKPNARYRGISLPNTLFYH
jgi:hypothetical protein